MMMPKVVLLLLLGFGATAVVESIDRPKWYDISSGENLDRNLEEHQRHLPADVCDVETTTTKTYYFEVTVRLEPDSSSDVCHLADQVLLGHDINLLFLDYGIGAAGADDDAIFLAGVCPQPSATSERRELRSFARRGYVWSGGGGCRGCFRDNRDGRTRNLQQQVTGSSEQDWFTNIYAPWLETALETAIANDIVPQHRSCMGQVPEHIDVEIIEVQRSDLELGCDDGRIIATLQSLSLKDAPLRDRDCAKCVSVNFSSYDLNDRTYNLKGGDYVKSNWKTKYGFTISASGGYSPSSRARIFDTGDQHCVNAANGNLDFGSPNQGCSIGGLGKGTGGTPGESGENCDPVGNVLVVQESNKACPDPNPLGGTIKFVFDTPVLISDIGLMDVDEADQRINITYADGVSELFAYPGFGDNAVQRIIFGTLNVKMIEVIFPGTGAITEINFCPECIPANVDQVERDQQCLTTEGGRSIRQMELLAFDEFESGDPEGWVNARKNQVEIGTYGSYISSFGNGALSPSKEYKFPPNAQRVVFQLNFYEIYSADSNGQVIIYIDGEKVDLGTFDSAVDEGTGFGTSKHGVFWIRRSLSKLKQLGFSAQTETGNKHRITLHVQEKTGLMKDGKLRLTLDAKADGRTWEAAGWDNVRATVWHGCPIPSPRSFAVSSASIGDSPTTIPAPTPTRNPTPYPTHAPTPFPTRSPTPAPTRSPTPYPTSQPNMNFY